MTEERAKELESTRMRERAIDRESTKPYERARTAESTKRRERLFLPRAQVVSTATRKDR